MSLNLQNCRLTDTVDSTQYCLKCKCYMKSNYYASLQLFSTGKMATCFVPLRSNLLRVLIMANVHMGLKPEN